MWEKFCDIYSPNAEERDKLKEMDFHTLTVLYDELGMTLAWLKKNEKHSKAIVGIETSLQIIWDIMMDKKQLESEEL
jgi:hypothetical protein